MLLICHSKFRVTDAVDQRFLDMVIEPLYINEYFALLSFLILSMTGVKSKEINAQKVTFTGG